MSKAIITALRWADEKGFDLVDVTTEWAGFVRKGSSIEGVRRIPWALFDEMAKRVTA